MKAVLFALNAKYIHSSLAPGACWRVMEAAGPCGCLCRGAGGGTVNEPERDVLARIFGREPDAVLFSCYLWNIRETLRLAAAVKAARPGAYVVLGGPEVSYNAGGGFGGKPAGGLYPLRRGRTQRAHAVGRRWPPGGSRRRKRRPSRGCAPGAFSAPCVGGGRAAQPVCAGVSGEPARAHCVSGDPAGAARMPARSAFLGGAASPAGSRWSRQNGTS